MGGGDTVATKLVAVLVVFQGEEVSGKIQWLGVSSVSFPYVR